MDRSARTTWVAPLALCCVLLMLFLIVVTIVLALIPVYLSTRSIDTNTKKDTIYAGYATDLVDGRSLTLANTGSVSSQLSQKSGLSNSVVSLQSGSYVAGTPTNGKKRQALIITSTCERATTLLGDIFVAQYQLNYPSLCSSTNCRGKYYTSVQNALRVNYQTFTLSMTFTNGETRIVQVVFCRFYNTSSTECTTGTRNNAYVIKNSVLYQFSITTFSLTSVGTINCASSAGILTIAVQRNGLFWVFMSNGKLYTYDITAAQCTETAFVQNVTNFGDISMAFVKSQTDNSETLYISQSNYLLQADLNKLTVSIVGTYSGNSHVSLVPTNDGRLFGLFYDDLFTIFTINQIDKTNAQSLSQYPIPQQVFNNAQSIAIVPYYSKFLLAVGYSSYTVVSIFDPSTNTVINQTSLPETDFYVGAVSTCLGT